MLTAEQHALRRTGLGGSDAGVVRGTSPWRGRFGLWHEKRTGERPEPKPEQLTRWAVGHALEPLVVEHVEQGRFVNHGPKWVEEQLASGELTITPGRSMVRSPELPIALANTDRTLADKTGSCGVLETKTAESMMFRNGWKEGVPRYYLDQVQHYLFVTGLRYGLVACLAGNQRVHLYHVERDEDFIRKALVPELTAFWNLVQSGEMPDVDDKEDTKAALRMFYGEREEAKILDLRGTDKADRLLELGHEIEEYKRERKSADAALKLLNNQAHALTEDASHVLLEDGFMFRWKRSGRGYTGVIVAPE